MSLARRILARYLRAAFIPEAWFKGQQAKLKSILKKPLRRDASSWWFELQEAMRPFYKEFGRELTDQIEMPAAARSIEDRVEMATTYLDALVEKLGKIEALERGADLNDPPSYLRWYAIVECREKMGTQAKTIGDLFRWSWYIDEAQLDRIVKKALKAATPNEMQALASDGRAKYEFLARVRYSEAAQKALHRTKLEKDPLAWIPFLYEVLQANFSSDAAQKGDHFREFSLHGIKVIIDDKTVTPEQVKAYVRYLDEAYARLKAKGFAKAWYGNVFIQCSDCGGVNPNTGGGTGGWFETAKDTVTIFQRPGPFVVELVIHELGHRWWFKSMTSEQRARFTDLVKVRTKSRPSVPAGAKLYGDENIRAFKQEVEIAQQAGTRAINRARKFSWDSATKAAKDGVSKSLWEASQDILGAVDRLEVERDIGAEAKQLKDDAYKASSALLERSGDITLIDEAHLEEWLGDVQQQLEMLAANALIYLDFAAQRHNEIIKERMGPAFREWAESYDRNPNPVPAVSDYGKSNTHEAFAEVFAHYVMEYNITRDQVESFRSVLARTKTASSVRIVVDLPKTLEARAKFGHPEAIVARFDATISLYRILDGEELRRILASGKITGGTYSVKAERAHGASWGENINDLVSWGNRERGNRLGDDIFLAKLDAFDFTFFHLNPEVEVDPDGPDEQVTTMDRRRINLGLGVSIMNVGLDDVSLYEVHPDEHIKKITPSEAKDLLKPPKDVDLRRLNPDLLQGSILGVDVRVWKKGPKWGVFLNDDRQIVSGADTPEDAIELAQMSIRMRPGKPVPMDAAMLAQKRKHERMFEQDDDPDKVRGDYTLKPRDRLEVTTGTRDVPAHSKLTVADVYQRKGERSIVVKAVLGGKTILLYATHPNRLKDDPIQLLTSTGGKVRATKVTRTASTEHYKIICSKCGDVISQCRCMGPKEIRYSVCDRCSAITQ
jgi:hypothetical protein